MKVALIGAGQRGMIYASYLQEKGVTIAAVVEPNEERRTAACKEFHIENAYLSLEGFLAEGKLADAAIVATMDRDHFGHAMALLDTGYDLLLEKPISPDSLECLKIQQKAEEKGLIVVVCHVLRYTKFFSTIKQLVDSGELGKVITIEYAEYMGNFHMAHSFVRGNWRNSKSSSPIILQKSCHDMDILVWLADSKAKSVSSFGSLTYFKEENAPEESTDRCSDCPVSDTCRFAAEKVYLPMIGSWRSVDVTNDMTEEGMRKALETGPYGRCVYRCDNNVCDHQVTALEFENGISATFHMSGFSDKIHRRIKVMCEHGSIEGDDSENTLTVTRYGSYAEVPTTPEIIELGPYRGRHGGGDYGIIENFIKIMEEKDSPSLISKSIESHLIANAAEESRISRKTVHMDEYRRRLGQGNIFPSHFEL